MKHIYCSVLFLYQQGRCRTVECLLADEGFSGTTAVAVVLYYVSRQVHPGTRIVQKFSVQLQFFRTARLPGLRIVQGGHFQSQVCELRSSGCA